MLITFLHYKGMEVIDLVLTEGAELDFQIALVDSPAIESDFMAFS